MSDFETRLSESLRAGAEGAPDAGGLAAAARDRARRRRTSMLAAVGAVVLAVVAIPVGITVVGDGEGRRAPGPPAGTSSPSESATPVPDGWRVESWRNVELQVPEEWAYGARVAWCASDGRNVALVERPGSRLPLIGCSPPQQGYGVTFGHSAAMDLARESGDVWRYGWESPDQVKVYPENAWVSIVVVNRVAVSVATPERSTTQTIVDSVRAIYDVDSNGCTPFDEARLPTSEQGGVSVCRYDAEGWLEQSELLSPEESQAALNALAAAPTREPEGCFGGASQAGTDFVHRGSRVRVAWDDDECAASNGVFFNGRQAELTEDVMYWALSPGWSGAVSRGVPLPDRLRR